jgi:hypothetical protein
MGDRFRVVHARAFRYLFLATLAGILAAPLAARAGFDIGNAANYGVLYEGNGGKTLSFNNSTLVGNVGIGGTGPKPGMFQGNGPGSITGNIDFAAPNSGQFSNSGVTITGTTNYSVSAVTNGLATINTLSQTLGLETGTSTTITSGGSVKASSGTLDGNGNRVFTVTNISFSNGTFTVNGSASDFVVFNIAGSVGNNGLNGSIVLNGGITADHVLFNYTPDTSNLNKYNKAYTDLSGGPTMTISTNGLATTGIFLDPTGDFQVNHTGVITGRILGGDTQNSSFVSGASLQVPTRLAPEPATLAVALAGVPALGLLLWRRRKHKATCSVSAP